MYKDYVNYYCRQKTWWRNMDNIVIHYRHKGEENNIYLIHMITPKERVDRVCEIKGYGWFR